MNLNFSPIVGARKTNHGIIVRFSEELFQIFETMSWKERVEKQISRLPKNTALDVIKKLTEVTTIKYNHNGCFPLYTLPPDACFVIRHTEVERLINLYKKGESSHFTFPYDNTVITPVLAGLQAQ